MRYPIISTIRKLLLVSACGSLASAIVALPAQALSTCARDAHAYATSEISLIDPLIRLQKCIHARLKVKNITSLKIYRKFNANWPNCRALAAAYAFDANKLSRKELIQFYACVTKALKRFPN